MRVSAKIAAISASLCLLAAPSFSDEIRLKDGKKLYGVIVAYEDNMFRIKTDFGFVLVEKDKIASIVPNASADKAPAEAVKAAKPAKAVPPTGSNTGAESESSNATASAAAPAKPKISTEPVRPELPAVTRSSNVPAPALKSTAPAASAPVPVAQPASAPKEPEPPAMKEQVQGTLYTNFSHGFRMYKAPSWEIIEDARRALPNAIVAMGTANESTLMVVGQEQSKDSLDACANSVEKRLREIYSNYRMISRRRTVVGGAPGVEFKFSGMAEEHQWSGTLVVISRGQDVLTILGMTFADNDLIQIQENVIARAIASTNFDVPKITAEK